jgi:hypothetical protein
VGLLVRDQAPSYQSNCNLRMAGDSGALTRARLDREQVSVFVPCDELRSDRPKPPGINRLRCRRTTRARHRKMTFRAKELQRPANVPAGSSPVALSCFRPAIRQFRTHDLFFIAEEVPGIDSSVRSPVLFISRLICAEDHSSYPAIAPQDVSGGERLNSRNEDDADGRDPVRPDATDLSVSREDGPVCRNMAG